MSMESRSKDDTETQGIDSSSAVPSGFILKLYQMVNGAPDEVISVSTDFVEASIAPMLEKIAFFPLWDPRLLDLCLEWIPEKLLGWKRITEMMKADTLASCIGGIYFILPKAFRISSKSDDRHCHEEDDPSNHSFQIYGREEIYNTFECYLCVKIESL